MRRQNIRDTFWNRIFTEARENSNIVLVSADLAAPALDEFRKEIPNQFISVGIAEQTAITVAAGLAMEGKKVYVYACSPFIFMRCYEQIKLCVADTGLPITIVGQGYGVCYVESGITHHVLEDIGAIRMLPNIRIFTPSDELTAEKIARLSLISNIPLYIRLDRPMPDVMHTVICEDDLLTGFSLIKNGGDILICSCGQVLHFAKEIVDQLTEDGIEVGLMDIIGINVDENKFSEVISRYRRVIVLEEHTISCGLGSYIAEICMDHHIYIDLKRYGLKSKAGYIHKYGSRKCLWELYGLDGDAIIADIKESVDE